MEFFEKLKPLGLLVLRVVLGASFIFHGYPKLSDPARALRALPTMAFPGYFALISGIVETFGGAMLVAGLFTRGAALLLAAEMGFVLGRNILPSVGIYAYAKYEQPLLFGAIAFALATTGAGAISIDAFTFESGRKSGKKK